MTDAAKFLRPGEEKCRGCGADVCWVSCGGQQHALDPKRVKIWQPLADMVPSSRNDPAWMGEGYTLHESTCPRIDAMRKAGKMDAGKP